jgi:hypothetical protein
MKKLLFLTIFLSLFFFKSQAQSSWPFFTWNTGYLTGEIDNTLTPGSFIFKTTVDVASLNADGLVLGYIEVSSSDIQDETNGDDLGGFFNSDGTDAPGLFNTPPSQNPIIHYGTYLPYYGEHNYLVYFTYKAVYLDAITGAIVSSDVIDDGVVM